jgi:hypothetical protein
MLRKFKEIFSGFETAYGKFVPSESQEEDSVKIKGSNKIIRKPEGLPDELWEDHLNGKCSLGIIPINKDNKCRWGCIDIDKYDHEYLKSVLDKIKKHSLPLVACRSKSGGLHLFLFFTTPAKANEVQSKLKSYTALLGCTGSEIFPKQVKLLLDKGQTGNYLNLPFYNARETERYVYDRDGNPGGIEVLFTMYNMYAQDSIESLTKKKKTSKKKQSGSMEGDTFEGGPPCLNILAESKVSEGGRNEYLTNAAMYLMLKSKDEGQNEGKGLSEDDLGEELQKINTKTCSPPLKVKEITTIAGSVHSKDYDYRCKVEPLASHCDKRNCKLRKYGKCSISDEVTYAALEKYGGEPYRWILTLDGLESFSSWTPERGTSVVLETPDTSNYKTFHGKVLEQLSVYLEMPPRTAEAMHRAKMKEVSDNQLTETAVEGTSHREEFLEILRKWCTDKYRALVKEEVAKGKPFTENGKHYFQLTALDSKLSRVRFNKYERVDVTMALESIGGKPTTYRVPTANNPEHKIACWSIPAWEVEEEVVIPIPDMTDKKEYEK